MSRRYWNCSKGGPLIPNSFQDLGRTVRARQENLRQFGRGPETSSGRRNPSGRVEVFPGDHPVEQGQRLVHAVERDEGPQARPLFLAQQDLVERLEPGPQVGEGIPLAHFVDFGLDRFRIRIRRQGAQCRREIADRLDFLRTRRAVAFVRADEIPVVIDREADEAVEGEMKPQRTDLSSVLQTLARLSRMLKPRWLFSIGGLPR